MGALEDNLEVVNQSDQSAGEWGRQSTQDLIRSRVKVESLAFVRGRTFINKFLIIDEALNLTPKQMKTLITRAGRGTKVVCMGNIAQIDTPYLTESSSGLTYVVDRFKGWGVTLQRGRDAGATAGAWAGQDQTGANNQFWVAFNKPRHALDLQVAQGRKRVVLMLRGLGHAPRQRPATTTSPSTSSMRNPQLQFRAIKFVEQLQCAFRVATRRTRFKAHPRVEVGQRDGG